ncbi:hypothetical protein K449DRAFT_438387 [Hypoxylon sp. EC38]|nr:hypothetical protein K449DRAFT_438387 [Hypoxylon sp. EC38]
MTSFAANVAVRMSYRSDLVDVLILPSTFTLPLTSARTVVVLIGFLTQGAVSRPSVEFRLKICHDYTRWIAAYLVDAALQLESRVVKSTHPPDLQTSTLPDFSQNAIENRTVKELADFLPPFHHPPSISPSSTQQVKMRYFSRVRSEDEKEELRLLHIPSFLYLYNCVFVDEHLENGLSRYFVF